MAHTVVFFISLRESPLGESLLGEIRALGERRYYTVGMVKIARPSAHKQHAASLDHNVAHGLDTPQKKIFKLPTPAASPPQATEPSLQNSIDTANENIPPSPELLAPQAPHGKEQIVHLDMPGWEWDGSPEVHDDSSETGKMIFELTIDEMGFVIGIKTVQKTVSPAVEHAYMDALARVTFSKRSSNEIHKSSTTTGLVTFVLRSS